MARMQSAALGEGKTVLFVSHNMAAISKLCHRVALLDRGTLRAIGSPQEVIAEYLHTVADKQRAVVVLTPEDLVQPIKRLVVTTFDGKGEITGSIKLGEPWQIRVEFEISSVLEHCIVAVGLRTLDSIPLVTVWSRATDLQRGDYLVEFAGQMTIAVGISSFERTLFYREELAQVSIADVAVGGQPLRASGAGFITSFSRPEIARIS
jgi:lipopolysaccharide transport system ATP-binding protein